MSDDAMALREGAESVAATLREAGYDAYYAGGCVRDLLLKKVPKDYDIVTNARPEQVQATFARTIAVGAAFGVIVVLLGKREYEVATYRSEREYSDGRRPDVVEYGDSPQIDVQRRDFTINALLMDPVSGEVLDFVDGRKDLQAGLIRAVGVADERFEEDRLRMLRAVRFAARFGFELESQTLQAIIKRQGDVSGVSAERLLVELEGIFASARPLLGLTLLHDTGLLKSVLPQVSALEAPAWDTTLSSLSRLQEELSGQDDSGWSLNWTPELQKKLCWSVILQDESPKDIEAILRNLTASKERMRGVMDLLARYRTARDAPNAKSPEVMRIVADGKAAETWALSRLLEIDNGGTQEKLRDARADQEASPLPRRPLLTGKDLFSLGMKPGPQMGDVLRDLDDAVLRREVKDEGSAKDFVREKLS